MDAVAPWRTRDGGASVAHREEKMRRKRGWRRQGGSEGRALGFGREDKKEGAGEEGAVVVRWSRRGGGGLTRLA
jgi:hypothetical protein